MYAVNTEQRCLASSCLATLLILRSSIQPVFSTGVINRYIVGKHEQRFFRRLAWKSQTSVTVAHTSLKARPVCEIATADKANKRKGQLSVKPSKIRRLGINISSVYNRVEKEDCFSCMKTVLMRSGSLTNSQ
ncbi:hypothetical protein ElyMa_001079500 [Elysia marginata]|uniref:Secreted protein n=1 Tax=Elysia marginata TaxID=1093978 RepID=A0AAV4HTK0_9GAST|nr:hypothetical protein ElyMa_001079500 [Elysia marginata]